ncbi:MAG: hypothetical protein PHX20_01100 [Candidatus Omnitrophica bacterium]|nr:hypothetical protein [Candidatus Omnitrophota bacterium]
MKTTRAKKQLSKQIRDFAKIEKVLAPFLKRPKIEEYSSRGKWQDMRSPFLFDYKQKNVA